MRKKDMPCSEVQSISLSQWWLGIICEYNCSSIKWLFPSLILHLLKQKISYIILINFIYYTAYIYHKILIHVQYFNIIMIWLIWQFCLILARISSFVTSIILMTCSLLMSQCARLKNIHPDWVSVHKSAKYEHSNVKPSKWSDDKSKETKDAE